MTSLLTNLSNIGVIRCKNCKAALATSRGRSVLIGDVILYGKIRLECARCEWGTWFYPERETKASAGPSGANKRHCKHE